MNTITKAQTGVQRNFTLHINDYLSGSVFAVYKTPTQFHWNGIVRIETDKGIFEYKDESAKSSKKFITHAQLALWAFIEETGAKLPEKTVLTEAEQSDRSLEFIANDEGKRIPMSDLVKSVSLRAPKVTAEDLKDYDDTQSEEDKILFEG